MKEPPIVWRFPSGATLTFGRLDADDTAGDVYLSADDLGLNVEAWITDDELQQILEDRDAIATTPPPDPV